MNPADLPSLVALICFLAFVVIGFTAVLEHFRLFDEHIGSADWHPGDPPNYRAYPCGERSCRVDHDRVRPWVEPRNR